MFKTIWILLLALLSRPSLAKIITISWTSSLDESLNDATLSHILALRLAESVPKLWGLPERLHIRLCPPAADPFAVHFNKSRFPGYPLFYDDGCPLDKTDSVLQDKPSSEVGTPDTVGRKYRTIQGLTLPYFIHSLYFGGLEELNDDIWLLDSQSLRAWLTGRWIEAWHAKEAWAHFFLQQMSSMGELGFDKELAKRPQAVQGALVIVLPQDAPLATTKDSVLDPTWAWAGMLPRDLDGQQRLVEKIVAKANVMPHALVMLHGASPDLVKELQRTYGPTGLIPTSQVVPQGTTYLELLQFFQKAGAVVVDQRDRLGQFIAASRTFDQRLYYINDFLSLDTLDFIMLTASLAWLVLGLIWMIRSIQASYSDPFHFHLQKFAFFAAFCVLPLICVSPSRWPQFFRLLWYTVFNLGYAWVAYSIIIFYTIALFITGCLLHVRRQRHKSPGTLYQELYNETQQ